MQFICVYYKIPFRTFLHVSLLYKNSFILCAILSTLFRQYYVSEIYLLDTCKFILLNCYLALHVLNLSFLLLNAQFYYFQLFPNTSNSEINILVYVKELNLWKSVLGGSRKVWFMDT